MSKIKYINPGIFIGLILSVILLNCAQQSAFLIDEEYADENDEFQSELLGMLELSEEDLRRLDKYEGVPDLYTRVNVGVNDDFGGLIEAVTYVRTGRADEAQPSKEYVAVIKQGYRDWGII